MKFINICLLGMFLTSCYAMTPHYSNGFECKVCENIVSVIDYDVKYANSTIQELTNVIEKICNVTTDPIANSECHFIMDSISKIVNWITLGLPTKEICYKLHLCNNTIV